MSSNSRLDTLQGVSFAQSCVVGPDCGVTSRYALSCRVYPMPRIAWRRSRPCSRTLSEIGLSWIYPQNLRLPTKKPTEKCGACGKQTRFADPNPSTDSTGAWIRHRQFSPRSADGDGLCFDIFLDGSPLGTHGLTSESKRQGEKDPISWPQDALVERSSVPEIELRGVTVQYGEKKVLDGVNLIIRKGESVALIGPSGAGTGKSTTLKLVIGLELPNAGTIHIRDWTRHRTIEDEFGAAKIAMVFQRAALFDSMTIGENVAFQLIYHSELPRARIDELAARALRRVGLSQEIMHLYPNQLSGGMQKRVSFARSILYDPDDLDGLCRAPEILLLDEPTTGLDPVISTQVEDCVRELQRVCPTSIVVTHQFSTVRRTVDRVVFLHDGKVRWDGKVAEIDDCTNPYVRQFFSSSLDGPMQFPNGFPDRRAA